LNSRLANSQDVASSLRNLIRLTDGRHITTPSATVIVEAAPAPAVASDAGGMMVLEEVIGEGVDVIRTGGGMTPFLPPPPPPSSLPRASSTAAMGGTQQQQERGGDIIDYESEWYSHGVNTRGGLGSRREVVVIKSGENLNLADGVEAEDEGDDSGKRSMGMGGREGGGGVVKRWKWQV
jgi:hypothetical protein